MSQLYVSDEEKIRYRYAEMLLKILEVNVNISEGMIQLNNRPFKYGRWTPWTIYMALWLATR